jgi:hypothetical protein
MCNVCFVNDLMMTDFVDRLALKMEALYLSETSVIVSRHGMMSNRTWIVCFIQRFMDSYSGFLSNKIMPSCLNEVRSRVIHNWHAFCYEPWKKMAVSINGIKHSFRFIAQMFIIFYYRLSTMPAAVILNMGVTSYAHARTHGGETFSCLTVLTVTAASLWAVVLIQGRIRRTGFSQHRCRRIN